MAYSTCNYTKEIDENECIGDSLQTINANFSALDTTLCNLRSNITVVENTVNTVVAGIPTQMNIRMSLSPTDPDPIGDITSTNLYVHPYNGNIVTLWNPALNRWDARPLLAPLEVNLALAGAQTPSQNYDVFLFFDNQISNFRVECIPWYSTTPGANPHIPGATPPPLPTKDGIFVKPGEPQKRLIGCVRTTESSNPPGQTILSYGRTAIPGGSNPRLFLWNLYNSEPVAFSIIDSGSGPIADPPGTGGLRTWAAPPVGGTQEFIPFGGTGNRVTFISRVSQIVTLTSLFRLQATFNNATQAYYFTYSLNVETPTSANIMQNLPGMIIHEQQGVSGDGGNQGFANVIRPGFHFIQLVHRSGAGLVHYVYTGERHSEGTTGTMLAF